MTSRKTRRPATAYIFGGMEAFLLQGLVAGFLGGLLAIKGYWRQIKAYFSGKPEGPKVPDETDANERDE